jgi:hypothetical protein
MLHLPRKQLELPGHFGTHLHLDTCKQQQQQVQVQQ